jgi:general nucleoside transport system permease protein
MKIKMNRLFVKNFELFRTLVAILIGFAISLILIYFISDEPIKAITTYMFKPFDGVRRIGSMIEYMIPIMFAGLGMCMMLAVSQFNLIGDGALFLAAAAVSYFSTVLIPNCPPVLFPILMIVAGAVIGGGCGVVPAYLQSRFKTNIVVVTLMMNYVLILGGVYMLLYWMRDPSKTYVGSLPIPEAAKLATIIPKTHVSVGIILAILATVGVNWFLNQTKAGYQMRMIGQNPQFAKYSGINVVKYVIIAQVIGGALAGIGGAVDILGKYDRFIWLTSNGYGFDGMMIAVIAKGNPKHVPLAALFLAYIKIGADLVGTTTDVPLDFVLVVQSVIVMLVAAVSFMSGIRQKAVVKIASAEKAGV